MDTENNEIMRLEAFFWHRLRWRAVRRYLERGRTFTLVDVGAGAGLIGSFLAKERPEIKYGFVEPIPEFAHSLEQRFGRAANLNDENTFYDAQFVTLLDVLEHQERDRDFLAELAEKIPAGARLIMTVPAMPSLWSEFDESIGHFKRYSKRSLASAVLGAPLAPVEVSYLFPEMIPLGLLRRRQRPPRGRIVVDDDDAMVATLADIPNLNAFANDLLFSTGLATQMVRKALPAGTSLFAVYERT